MLRMQNEPAPRRSDAVHGYIRQGEKKMSEENLVIRSKGALADSSDELLTDADLYATYSMFAPELVEKFMEKLEEKDSDGSS